MKQVPSGPDGAPPTPTAEADPADLDAVALETEAQAIAKDVAAWADAFASARGQLPADPARFAGLCGRLERLQRAAIPAYERISAAAPAGRFTPALMPVAAWKRLPLQLPSTLASPQLRFVTSGTGDGERGVVRLRSAALYDHVALRTCQALVQRGAQGMTPAPRVLALMPGPGLRPDSSLGHMAAAWNRDLGDGAGGFLIRRPEEVSATAVAGADGAPEAVDVAAFRAHVDAASAEGRPIVVVTTTLALGLCAQVWPKGQTLKLPAGSWLVDTGGDKGRRTAFDRGVTHRFAHEVLGLSRRNIVGELGMTELASQRYEAVRSLPAGASDAEVEALRDRYVGPPWLRSVVLDSATMRPLPPGEPGLVGHIDLANVETLAFVLTADLGSLSPTPFGDALRLHGRLPGSEWRGCGLRVEDVIEQLGGLA